MTGVKKGRHTLVYLHLICQHHNPTLFVHFTIALTSNVEFILTLPALHIVFCFPEYVCRLLIYIIIRHFLPIRKETTSLPKKIGYIVNATSW